MHVKNGHHNRSEGFNTLVDTSSQPGGPTSLGGTRDDEALDARDIESLSELLNGIHSTDRGFGLRELQEPLFGGAGVVQELLPSVSDDTIFGANLLGGVGIEHDGLVGNLLEI